MFVPKREHPPRVAGAEPETSYPRPAMVFFISDFNRTPDASPVREPSACTVAALCRRLNAPWHAGTRANLPTSSRARVSCPASSVTAGEVPGTHATREH
jgi:hypothetical protein